MISDFHPTPDSERFAACAPDKGTAMLACRCGAILDAAGMHFAVPPRPTAAGSLVIDRICCATCAHTTAAVPEFDPAHLEEVS